MPDNFDSHWEFQARRNQEIRDAGRCLVSGKAHSRLVVVCPFNEAFVADIGRSGRWRKRTLTWTFKWSQLSFVMKICRRYFPGKVQYIPYSKLKGGDNGRA